MANITRRQELLGMFDERTNEERCDIISVLKERGIKLTADIDEEIVIATEGLKVKRDDVDIIYSAISREEKVINALYAKRAEMLEKHKLKTFKHTSCGRDSVHADLVKFDAAKRDEREKLVLMKLPR